MDGESEKNYRDFDEYLQQGEPARREKNNKHPTSTQQVTLVCDNLSVRAIISVIGERLLSVRQIMDEMKLKDRVNLLHTYLNPAIEGGWVTPLYPQNPRHPRQKNQLTVKGMAFYRLNQADKQIN